MIPEQQSIIDDGHRDRENIDYQICNLKDQQIKYFNEMSRYFCGCGNISFEHAKKLVELCGILREEIDIVEKLFAERQDKRIETLKASK